MSDPIGYGGSYQGDVEDERKELERRVTGTPALILERDRRITELERQVAELDRLLTARHRKVMRLRDQLAAAQERAEVLKVERDGANERARMLLTAKNEWADKARDTQEREGALRDILRELTKTAAAYVQLADQMLAQADFPGIRSNRNFAEEWGKKGVAALTPPPAEGKPKQPGGELTETASETVAREEAELIEEVYGEKAQVKLDERMRRYAAKNQPDREGKRGLNHGHEAELPDEMYHEQPDPLPAKGLDDAPPSHLLISKQDAWLAGWNACREVRLIPFDGFTRQYVGKSEHDPRDARLEAILKHWQSGIDQLDTPWKRKMAELVGDTEGLADPEHNPPDPRDAVVEAARLNCPGSKPFLYTAMDGDVWMAVWPDFESLQESDAAFHESRSAAALMLILDDYIDLTHAEQEVRAILAELKSERERLPAPAPAKGGEKL